MANLKSKKTKEVVVVLPCTGNKVLMQLRDFKEGIIFPGHWAFFGGSIDKAETPLEAAFRELDEEIGYKATSLDEGSKNIKGCSTPHPEDPDPERSEGRGNEGSLTVSKDKHQAGYLYILTNQSNSVLYVGAATNLVKRVCCHKRKYLHGFTERYNLNKLVYYEVFIDIASTCLRERKIKGWKREKKISLIESMNPNWEDLYDRFRKDPSALRPQDDPSLIVRTPRGVSLDKISTEPRYGYVLIHAFSFCLAGSLDRLALKEGTDLGLFSLEEVRKKVLYSQKLKKTFPVADPPYIIDTIEKALGMYSASLEQPAD